MNEKRFRYLCVKDNGSKGISIKFSRDRKFTNIKKGTVVKLSEAEAKMFPTYFDLIDVERKNEIKKHVDVVLNKIENTQSVKDDSIEEVDDKGDIEDINDELEEEIKETEEIRHLYTEEELSDLRSSQIREILNQVGLDNTGSKSKLIARYLEYVFNYTDENA
jgi:hypothetical protein